MNLVPEKNDGSRIQTTFFPQKKLRKAVFFDRDDTLIHSVGNRPANTVEEVCLINTVPQALRMLKDSGFRLFVVSNQGGVAMGYLTAAVVHAQNERINELLAAAKAPKIDGFCFCVHHPQAGCHCRKPKPGMLHMLEHKAKIDLSLSYMVGDQTTDMAAGNAAGVKACLMVSNGKYVKGKTDEADGCFPNMLQCAAAILAVEENS